MNNKISVGLALAITIVAIAVTFTLTMAMSRTLYNSIITNLSLRTSVSAAIEEINGIVSNYYYGSVDDRTSVITSTLVEGYVNGLGDSGNGYLSSEEYAEYTERLNGGLTGIGIETYYNPVTSEYSVVYVYEDSPAEKAGLQKGDVIVSIEGEKVTRINYQELEKQLYGGKLSSVEIVYSRDGKQSTVEPMLGFEIPTVVSQMLSGNIAKVRITAFYKDTPAEFESVMKSLQEKGAVGFIIDLRGTSEGTVEYAARTLDVIVPAPSGNQTLAVTYDKNGSKIDAYAAESGSINSTFAVLVNNGTAGPAELFAADLKDISSATIVGSQTKGIQTVQRAFPLDCGDAVLLTVARLETYDANRNYNGEGITPDITRELDQGDSVSLWAISVSDDAQVREALKIFS